MGRNREEIKVGTKIKTKISRLAQFGAFVQLSDDITGLIHNSEIAGNPEDPAKVLEVGQAVEARVIEINKDEKRIGLSLLAEGESAAEKKAAKKEAKDGEGKRKNARKLRQEGGAKKLIEKAPSAGLC
jgi:small subunit ribosomal protein S1